MKRLKVTIQLAASLLALVLLFTIVPQTIAQDDDGGAGDEGDFTTQVVQLDTSNFPQIDIWVSVTDADGEPVRTLPAEAFTVAENGQTVEIQEVFQAGEQGSVTTVLVMDRSGSMLEYDKLSEARAAARAFVDLMRADDQTGLVVFNTETQIAQPITNDQVALNDAIDQVEAFNDTAVNDAVDLAIDLLSGHEGRKVIIVLSDGMDNSSSITVDDVLVRLADAEISIYTIGLGNPEAGTSALAGIDEEALQAIAEQSRGTYMYTPDSTRLSDLYQQISRQLQNEYRIRYVSPQTLYDGVAREIDVQINEGEATVIETAYNPGGVIPETEEQLSWTIFAGLMAGLTVLLTIPGALRAVRRQPKKKSRVKLKDPDSAKTRAQVRLKE